MRNKLIFVALLLAALMPAVLAFSVPSASAAPAAHSVSASSTGTHARAKGTGVAPSKRTCDERYVYSTGIRGILSNIPYAKAKWTHNTCTWYLQTKVKYTTSCINAPYSGIVKKVDLWAESDGTGHIWCSGWVRFHAGGEPWGSWHKMGS